MQIYTKYLMILKLKAYKELMKIPRFLQPNNFQVTIGRRVGVAQVLLKEFYLIIELFQGATSES